jgi:hypothetical protein
VVEHALPDHLALEHVERGDVNAERTFLKSAEVNFPT